ncbi:hypothetical protein MMC25_003327 [Agyrium rufum]|nr:hypothetical protein [Agyrium rufum]
MCYEMILRCDDISCKNPNYQKIGLYHNASTHLDCDRGLKHESVNIGICPECLAVTEHAIHDRKMDPSLTFPQRRVIEGCLEQVRAAADEVDDMFQEIFKVIKKYGRKHENKQMGR